MEFGVSFFMECQCPDQKLVVEHYLDFFWLCEEDDAKLLNGRRMRLVRRGENYVTTIKVYHFGFCI
jgi:hypothetical protein